jgi:hypothetical protein
MQMKKLESGIQHKTCVFEEWEDQELVECGNRATCAVETTGKYGERTHGRQHLCESHGDYVRANGTAVIGL